MKIVFIWAVQALLMLPMGSMAQQPSNTLNVKTDGTAVGDGVTDDAAAIQAILDTADAQNKNLYFPPGTYVIGSDITTRQGVSLLGDHNGMSIIRSAPGTAHKIGNQTWSSPSSNVDVEDLLFLNCQLHWYGSESVRKNIHVRRCLFFANDTAFASTTTDSQFQIALGHVVDGAVEDCVFMAQAGSIIECISSYQDVRQAFRRNAFGIHMSRAQWLETEWQGYSAWTSLSSKIQTLRTLFNLNDDQGYFIRAIAVNGSTDTRIEHNIFNGSPYTPVTPVNRDHVIYAWGGYSNLEVLSNWMRGWPSAPNGGLKMRNTQGTSTVIANRFVNTPILQYAYDNDPAHPFYENAIVHRNRFDIYQNFSDGRLGISFWETVDGVPSQVNNEYSANLFECPKSYASCINLTNGDLDGHTAYDSNVYLSDGTPVTTAHQSGPFALVPGGPDPSRYTAYDAYQIPDPDIPTYTTDPVFSTNLIDLGNVFPAQAVTGSVASLALDGDGEPLEFMKMDGPDWLTVNLDGTYTGTPELTDAGTNEFTIRAADNRDGYGETTLRINVHANLTTLSLQPIHDTHVSQENPGLNYGSNTKLVLRSDKYDTGFNGFLMFDVDTAGMAVTSAKLRLYCSQNDIILSVHEVSDTTWTEGSMIWSNQPAIGEPVSSHPAGIDVWEEFDVSAYVSGDGKISFSLMSDEASYSNIDTKEGAHPPVLEIVVASNSTDWDDDGIPNDWELAYFGGETNAVASGHSDDDDFDNLAEYIAGSNPTNGSSFFAAFSGLVPSGFVVSWDAVSNRSYGVWRCPSLGDVFTNLQSGLNFPQNSFTDTVHAAESKGFYKVDVQLMP